MVGSINTGAVQTIDVSITYLKNAGSDKASIALKELAETIANDATCPDTEKNQMLDQVAFLGEQAVAGAKDRRPGLIKATFAALSNAASSVSALADAWVKAEAVIKPLLGSS